jgi:hypothetical protein
MQGYCKSAQVTVQAFGAGPVSRVSKEDLERHERIAKLKAYNQEVQAWIDQTLLERKEMEQQEQLKVQQGAAVPRAKPPKKKKAAGPRPAPVEWPPVAEAGAVPGMACPRQAAAEASAAAAAAWAATAAGREAVAQAAAERAAGQPAGQHTAGAEEWERAAAAWHAAHQALDAARQACPDAPVVLEADAAVQAARALKAQRQGWRGS